MGYRRAIDYRKPWISPSWHSTPPVIEPSSPSSTCPTWGCLNLRCPSDLWVILYSNASVFDIYFRNLKISSFERNVNWLRHFKIHSCDLPASQYCIKEFSSLKFYHQFGLDHIINIVKLLWPTSKLWDGTLPNTSVCTTITSFIYVWGLGKWKKAYFNQLTLKP